MKPLLRAALGASALSVVVAGCASVGANGADRADSASLASSARVAQRGVTTVLPQIVQPGTKPASATGARLVGQARFSPVRKGRPVLVQRRVGSGAWVKHTVLRENGSGVVSFTGPARARGKWVTYRAVARRYGGLPAVRSSAQSATVWKQRFIDQFGGTSLDQSKWDYRNLGLYAPGDRACSASTKDAVVLGGGRVSLLMKPDPARDRAEGPCVARDADGNDLGYPNRHWFKNGTITTQGKFSARYGVAAARVKFARAQGAHGSFWMQSTMPGLARRGPSADGAEIDTVEYFGKDYLDGDVFHFIHYMDSNDVHHKLGGPTPVAKRALRGTQDWWNSYHVFSVQWTPSAYTFYVDGIRVARHTQGISKQQEYLILSMLSSGWEIEKMKDASVLPISTQVDWVRYWQHS